ncbi:MAG: hypothetical protein PVH41_01360 [Anaerolineae bacterium]|jgi:uncharacterized repeat protein (TIGR01451 family)
MRIHYGTKGAVLRFTRMLLTVLAALTLLAGLSLVLSHLQVLAKPAAEITAAALHVEKEVSEDVASPGDVLTYTVTVRNSGDASTMAWLTDTLPGELVYVADSLGATFGSWGVQDDTITWTAEMFGYNYTAVLTFSAQISTEEQYVEVVNTVQLTGTGELLEDSVSTTSAVDVGNLDTSFTTKSVSSDQAEPGDVVTYTIRIENADGSHPYLVPNARLTDTLPEGLSYVSGSLSALDPGAQYGVDSGVITWSNTLQYLSFDEIRFSAQISTGVPLDSWVTNSAEIVAPLQSFTRSVATYIRPDIYITYFPALFGRWPPVPYSPSLQAIENEDEDVSYRVSWTYDASHPAITRPDSYTLQEAEDDAFTVNVRSFDPAAEPDCLVDANGGYCDLDNDSGTYYYRVRGQNQAGMGPWSNVQSVYVWGYEDDFSDYQSGWPRKWQTTRGALYQVRPYEHPDCGSNKDCKYEEGDGYVIARRAESKPYARFSPEVEVPVADYELEVDARWFEAQYHATYEIIFSAEDDFDSYYSVKVFIDNPDKPSGKAPECSYQVYKQEDDGDKLILHDFDETDAINCGVLHCGRSGSKVDPDDPCGDTAWNEWKIEVENGHIKVRVNGTHLGTWTDHDEPFGPDRVFGVGATLYEGLTPSKPVFDNFEVELGD